MFAQPPPAAAAAAGFGAPPPGFGAPPPAGAGPADTPASLMDRLDAMEQTILQRLAEVEARVAAVERQAASITTTLLGPPSASSPATPATPVAGQPAEAPAGMLKIVQQLGSQLAHLQKSLDQMGAQGFDPHAASHAGGSDSSSIHSTESASPGGLKMMFGRKPLNRRSTGSLPYRSGGKGSDSLEEAAGSYEASAPAPAPVSSRKRWFNTDHAASVDITTLDTAEVKRQDVAYEFVDSEADYVRDLKIMLEVYKQKIVEAACISEAEVHSLFHNAEALLEANEAFAERLAARRRETPVVIHIAELLTEALPSFEPYIEYCSNHPVAVEVLSGLLRAGGAFKTQTEALWNDNPDTRRLSLESYLIKPVQRICKYPLLLRELSRSMTEEHPDFVHTQTATARIEELLSRINSATRQAANARRFAGLIEQLDLPQDVRSFELAHPGRELLAALAVRQSVVPPTGSSGPKKLMEDRQVFVFNDVLISCRADPATVPLTAGASPRPVSASGGRLILCDSISLAVVNCEPISASYGINNKSSAVSVLGGDSGSHSFHTPASFIIHLPASKETIEFVLPSEDERDSAVRLIKGAIVKLVEADPTKLINNNLNGLPLRRSAAYIPPDAGAAGGAGATQQRSRFARDKDKERPSYWTDKSSGLVFLRGSEWLKDNPTSFPSPAIIENETELVYVATSDHMPQNQFEIRCERGSYLIVTNQCASDYWKVEMKDVIGYVRSSGLKKVENSTVSAIIEQLKKSHQPSVSSCQLLPAPASALAGDDPGSSRRFGLRRRNSTNNPNPPGALFPPMATSAADRRRSTGISSSDIPKYQALGRTWIRALNPGHATRPTEPTHYFYCPDTYETSWDLPKEDPATLDKFYKWYSRQVPHAPGWYEIEMAPDSADLPPAHLAASGPYFFNPTTRQTAWTLPPSAGGAPGSSPAI